jgi:hypothetical protein
MRMSWRTSEARDTVTRSTKGRKRYKVQWKWGHHWRTASYGNPHSRNRLARLLRYKGALVVTWSLP